MKKLVIHNHLPAKRTVDARSKEEQILDLKKEIRAYERSSRPGAEGRVSVLRSQLEALESSKANDAHDKRAKGSAPLTPNTAATLRQKIAEWDREMERARERGDQRSYQTYRRVIETAEGDLERFEQSLPMFNRDRRGKRANDAPAAGTADPEKIRRLYKSWVAGGQKPIEAIGELADNFGLSEDAVKRIVNGARDHSYRVSQVEGYEGTIYEIWEGAGVDGGDWFVKQRGRTVYKAKSRREAKEWAEHS